MNMRNINVITARAVADKNVSDECMHAVLRNCPTKTVPPAAERLDPEEWSNKDNTATVGEIEKRI